MTEETTLAETMLTTIDNPFDPFINFDEWNAFDMAQGYNTCAYLARITVTSDDLSEASQQLAISQAINEIVDMNLNGLYIKVTKDWYKD